MSSSTAIEVPIEQKKCSLTACFKIQRDVVPSNSLPANEEESWKELCDEIDAALYAPPCQVATVSLFFLIISLVGSAMILAEIIFKAVGSIYLLIGVVIDIAVVAIEFVILKCIEAHMRTTLSSICDAWNSHRRSSQHGGGGIVASLKEKPKNSCVDAVPKFFVELETAPPGAPDDI